MTGAGTQPAHNNIGKRLHSKPSHTKRPRKRKPHGNTTRNAPISKKKLVDILTNGGRKKDFKRRNISPKSSENQKKRSDESVRCRNGDFSSKRRRGRKRKRKRERAKNEAEVDEASRLQRRTRYLLIKMKIEQNLLDAYSTEGWKGQSREKIKPEKELQRAKKQILKCKLGLRDAIRQLDSLSSDGCIDESVIGPDGSVHHDHIHCAKCKLRDAFPDNDIILCDGTCNCAFHQMCIDPPLLTENIPPGDQGWFCKYCICKTEIIEALNAHLGTNYPNNSRWEEIFKAEAAVPDDGGDGLLGREEWPSEDSGDDDYDPDGAERRENNSEGESSGDDDSGGSSDGADSDSDCGVVGGRRQRRAVDYRKLYDEMFGKDALANEQVSEDEDWGPTNRKRREKESDAATTLMTLCDTEEKNVDEPSDTAKIDPNPPCNDTKRSFFRIPAEAVEKLRVVFAENELPSRAVKEELSEQLGLDLEKVNKWFKNARYLAVKTRKSGDENPVVEEHGSETGKRTAADETVSAELPESVGCAQKNRRMKKFRKSQNHSNKQHGNTDARVSASDNKADGKDEVSLKTLPTEAQNVDGSSQRDDDDEAAAAAEAEMERLSLIKRKLEKLQRSLPVKLRKRGSKAGNVTETVFVPVAYLKEKP